jgi:hypothetical protein
MSAFLVFLQKKMVLKVGDRVKFLNAVGGGKITGFVSPKVANVEDDQGFEVPTLISELVKDERFGKVEKASPVNPEASGKGSSVAAKKQVKEWLPLYSQPQKEHGSSKPAYYLAFVPEVPTMPLSGEIKSWLVNDTPYALLFVFSLLADGEYISEKSGKLPAYSKILLKGFGLPDFSNFPGFGFQLLPNEKKCKMLLPALVKTIRLNPVKFYKETSFAPSPYFEKRALISEIGENDMSSELDKLRQHDFSLPVPDGVTTVLSHQAPRLKESRELKEVDLHIEQLVDQVTGLSGKEILDIQMEKFRTEMLCAMREGIRRLVFIHGIGQGTLKKELRRELGARYKKVDIQDASFKEYGYGATMVIFP